METIHYAVILNFFTGLFNLFYCDTKFNATMGALNVAVSAALTVLIFKQ